MQDFEEPTVSHRISVYLAPSGQWAGRVFENDEEIAGGAGYSSSQEAHEACDEHLSIFHRDPEVVRRPSNRFALVLARLPDAVTQTCLQAVCNGLRGTRAIEEQVQCGNMEPHLVRLVELGLVTDDLVGGWKPTWLGVGVASWNQQVRWASVDPRLILTEPRENENGQDILADCDEFREHRARPGRCWSGKHQADHPSEMVKQAEKLLRQNRKPD